MNIEELKIMNNATILYLNKQHQNCFRNEIIKKILDDESCFFKMSQDDAYIILEDIGISHDKVGSVYTKLISYDNYYSLLNSGKINENDPEVIIKYKPYSEKDLFKKLKGQRFSLWSTLVLLYYLHSVLHVRFSKNSFFLLSCK